MKTVNFLDSLVATAPSFKLSNILVKHQPHAVLAKIVKVSNGVSFGLYAETCKESGIQTAWFNAITTSGYEKDDFEQASLKVSLPTRDYHIVDAVVRYRNTEYRVQFDNNISSAEFDRDDGLSFAILEGREIVITDLNETVRTILNIYNSITPSIFIRMNRSIITSWSTWTEF